MDAAEFFYGLCRDSWGRGYGLEAARKALEFFVREYDNPCYKATVDVKNTASIKILQKLGFECESENDGLLVYKLDIKSDFGFSRMQELQKRLQEKYKAKWGGLYPAKARDMLLWMMAEAGEAAQVVKKSGDKMIIGDKDTREHFIEEMCDVLMYFNDVMLCYSISPDELKKIYMQKHSTNMKRWQTGGSRQNENATEQ